MTSRKFSRKRIGQALGLLVLGLALLVGSAGYGSADYERAGGHQQAIATQQEQQPATFIVEATVNRNGGLEVQLPDPPQGPGAFLEVQFVVDGSREPHQLVPRGTRVTVMGIVKGRLTQFKSLEDLGSLVFLATVGSGAQERKIVAEVTSAAWSSSSSLGNAVTNAVVVGNIFLPKALLLLAPEGPPYAWFNADFLCCERPRAKLVTGPLNPGQETPLPPLPGGGPVAPPFGKSPFAPIPGDPLGEEPEPPPPGRTFVDAAGNRVVALNFEVVLALQCAKVVGGCTASLNGRVEQHPKQSGALPTAATLEISQGGAGACDGGPERFFRIRVRYVATYKGAGHVFGPLVVHLTTGAAPLPPRIIPPGIVKDDGKGRVIDQYMTSGDFDTSKQKPDKEKEGFPVTWKETKK